jgi:hypothetical protein
MSTDDELNYNLRDDIPDKHLSHVPKDIDDNCPNPRCNDPCLNRADSPSAQTTETDEVLHLINVLPDNRSRNTECGFSCDDTNSAV